MPERACIECGASLQGLHFNATRCSEECKAIARKAKYDANRDVILAKKAEYYVRKHDEIKLKQTAWRAENRDHINEASAGYRKRDREKLRLRQAAWRLANPDYMRSWELVNAAKISENNFRRRVRMAAAKDGVTVTQRDWDRLIQRYDNKCAYCHCSLDGCFTIDHVMPIAKGGRHTIGNLVPACKPCNSSKRDLLLFDWLQLRASRLALAA